MRRKWMVAAIGATMLSAAAAWGQWGPGMMEGYGGPGYGGYGPGMMGGYGGGYGPGMMGGYGGGYGPGMMGGYGGGYGRYGMGPGMHGGWGGAYGNLDLTDEQRGKIVAIEKEASNKRWGVMQAMHELRWNSLGPDAKDADIRKTYDAMAALRKQMFEANLDAQQRIEAVLTKEQKEQLRKESRRGW